MPVAAAHSFPEQETPSAGQQLSTPPSEVSIKFDAPIEKLFAKLEVLGTDGKPETMGPPRGRLQRAHAVGESRRSQAG